MCFYFLTTYLLRSFRFSNIFYLLCGIFGGLLILSSTPPVYVHIWFTLKWNWTLVFALGLVCLSCRVKVSLHTCLEKQTIWGNKLWQESNMKDLKVVYSTKNVSQNEDLRFWATYFKCRLIVAHVMPQISLFDIHLCSLN